MNYSKYQLPFDQTRLKEHLFTCELYSFLEKNISYNKDHFQTNPPLFQYHTVELDDLADHACLNNNISFIYYLEQQQYEWQWKHFRDILIKDDYLALSIIIPKLFGNQSFQSLEDNHFLFLNLAVRHNSFYCFEILKRLKILSPNEWILVSQTATLSSDAPIAYIQYILNHIESIPKNEKTEEVENLIFYMLKNNTSITLFEQLFATLTEHIQYKCLSILEHICEYKRKDVLKIILNTFHIKPSIAFFFITSVIRTQWNEGLKCVVHLIEHDHLKIKQLIECCQQHQNQEAITIIGQTLNDTNITYLSQHICVQSAALEQLIAHRQKNRLTHQINKSVNQSDVDKEGRGKRKI